LPYKIAGFGGTFYAPGERKANRWIVWRGRDDAGTKLEIATDARDPAGAKAYVNKHLAERTRRRPPAAGASDVTLDLVSAHYKAERHLDETHPDWRRLAFIEGRDGKLEVRGINNAAIRATAEAWLKKRCSEVAAANAELIATRKRPRHKLPTFATANREVVTPYRALLKFAAEQDWHGEIVVRSLKAPEGSLPPNPPRIADDKTVFALLDAIEEKIRTAPTPWTRRKHLEKRAFVWLCHERGYRIGEWLRFDWEWVDLSNARGRMAITKNKHELRWEEFELSPTAVAYLATLEPREAGKVFPGIHAATSTAGPISWSGQTRNGGRTSRVARSSATSSPAPATTSKPVDTSVIPARRPPSATGSCVGQSWRQRCGSAPRRPGEASGPTIAGSRQAPHMTLDVGSGGEPWGDDGISHGMSVDGRPLVRERSTVQSCPAAPALL
jgi:hypothetical protein